MLTTLRSRSRMLVRLGLLTCIATGLACDSVDNPVDARAPTAARDRPAQLAIWPAIRAAGDDSAWAGSTLVTTPAVRVVWLLPDGGTSSMTDVGVPSMTVRCAVTAGGGSIHDTVVVTDAYGLASCGEWTLGPNAGTNTVTITVADVAPIAITTHGRPRPDIVASYTLVAQEGNPDPSVARGQLVLGSDGTLEVGQDYYWNVNPTGAPMPPSRWRLGAYAITGSTFELLDSPRSIGEIRGDSLIVTTRLGDPDGPAATMRTVYVRSDLLATAAPRRSKA